MGQSRRSFLTMLGLAPFAAPAVVSAAAPAAAGTARGEWAARFAAGSVSRARGVSRILIADEIDHWPDAMRFRRPPELVSAETHFDHIAHLAPGSVSALGLCPVLIDDAGGGP